MTTGETGPDSTAVRTALWRALHLEIEQAPFVLEDPVGLELADPEPGWRQRGDMHPQGTMLFRASIIARARFIEDLVAEQAEGGVDQYVILGSGLDTFAQRRPELAGHLQVFEVDQPEHQAWKHARLVELGYGVPDWLHLVPVDFEAGESWRAQLTADGFDPEKPAVVASTGVSMYLTRETNTAALGEVAALAPGTTLASTFLVPMELADPAVRPGLEMSARGAAASGHPFISYFTPDEMLELAVGAGFSHASHVSSAALAARYFSNRADDFRPPDSGEELLVANV